MPSSTLQHGRSFLSFQAGLRKLAHRTQPCESGTDWIVNTRVTDCFCGPMHELNQELHIPRHTRSHSAELIEHDVAAGAAHGMLRRHKLGHGWFIMSTTLHIRKLHHARMLCRV
ncbi:unnamed protein product [Symbiodinium sp. CCMP2456]|nr:unnamed protein product [Symbiodinium sp. CCMP2456]